MTLLRDTCNVLEKQLESYQKVIAGHKSKEADLQKQVLELSSQTRNTRSDENRLPINIEVEETLNEYAKKNAYVASLKQDIDLLNKECSVYKANSKEYSKQLRQLHEEMTLNLQRSVIIYIKKEKFFFA